MRFFSENSSIRRIIFRGSSWRFPSCRPGEAAERGTESRSCKDACQSFTRQLMDHLPGAHPKTPLTRLLQRLSGGVFCGFGRCGDTAHLSSLRPSSRPRNWKISALCSLFLSAESVAPMADTDTAAHGEQEPAIRMGSPGFTTTFIRWSRGQKVRERWTEEPIRSARTGKMSGHYATEEYHETHTRHLNRFGVHTHVLWFL